MWPRIDWIFASFYPNKPNYVLKFPNLLTYATMHSFMLVLLLSFFPTTTNILPDVTVWQLINRVNLLPPENGTHK